MQRNIVLPEGITKSHISQAAILFDAHGMPKGYKPSHTYDVEINTKVYPPPAIVALAAELLTGTLPEPGFMAGKGTKCFQILTDAGFEIRRKSKHD